MNVRLYRVMCSVSCDDIEHGSDSLHASNHDHLRRSPGTFETILVLTTEKRRCGSGSGLERVNPSSLHGPKQQGQHLGQHTEHSAMQGRAASMSRRRTAARRPP